jgi:hypothetical protein
MQTDRHGIEIVVEQIAVRGDNGHASSVNSLQVSSGSGLGLDDHQPTARPPPAQSLGAADRRHQQRQQSSLGKL